MLFHISRKVLYLDLLIFIYQTNDHKKELKDFNLNLFYLQGVEDEFKIDRFMIKNLELVIKYFPVSLINSPKHYSLRVVEFKGKEDVIMSEGTYVDLDKEETTIPSLIVFEETASDNWVLN